MPGKTLKPLGRVASGGETARLMLALKSILSAADATPTLVFDEVDVGVGGRSGQVVGEKLWALAGGHQVVVISHLPQIAAFAETHFRIGKAERGDRVVSEVEQIDGTARIDELAAMLDGYPVTSAARVNAQAMLERVERWKGRAQRRRAGQTSGLSDAGCYTHDSILARREDRRGRACVCSDRPDRLWSTPCPST